MIELVTRTLKAEKYGLPKAGTFTGRQLAQMLRQKKAPEKTIQVFENFSGNISINSNKTIIIDFWK